MRLSEIANIPDYQEERNWSTYSPVWGNEDDYELHDVKGPMEVRIFRPQGQVKIVGYIEDQPMAYLALMQIGEYYQVRAVQVSSKYRGRGVAPYFYDVALVDLGLTILSDDSQTRGGQGIWRRLEANPTYEISAIDLETNSEIPLDQVYNRSYRTRLVARAKTTH